VSKLKCPKCSEGISKVDTYCPSCGEFLKTQKFERKREEKVNLNVDLLPPESTPERSVVACPQCGQKLSVPKQKAVLMITCPKCGNTFRLNSN